MNKWEPGMRKYILLFIAWVICNNCMAQLRDQNDAVSILPKPVSVSFQKGYFAINPAATAITADKKAAELAAFLSDLLHQHYGYALTYNERNVLSSSINTKAGIELIIYKKPDISIGDEGYHLKVTSQEIILSANNPHGLFYGVQTLMQLLPPASNGEDETKNGNSKYHVLILMIIQGLAIGV